MNRRDFLVTGLAAGSLSPLVAAAGSEAAQQSSGPDKVKDVQVLVFEVRAWWWTGVPA